MKKLWIYLRPFLNWRFLICFGLAWMITNGWCYIGFAIGVWMNINWLKIVCGGYMAFLYFPFTVEKLITIPMAIFFQKLLFKNDNKLFIMLCNMKREAKKDAKRIKYLFYDIWHYERMSKL